MVCLGNICRSPLAEGILKNKLPQDRFRVDSAGTAGYHIGQFSQICRSIEVAAQNGIDISHQKARKFLHQMISIALIKSLSWIAVILINIKQMALTLE